jgi:HEAT repeat protein
VAKLKDPDLVVRINAVNELGAKGQAARPALSALIDLLKNPPPLVPKPGTDVAKEITLRTDLNSALAQAIERIGPDLDQLPSLLQGLKGGDRTAVTVSALLLAIMGDPAVDPLLELLKDKDPELRLRAIRAFAFSRDLPDRAIKPIIARLEDDNDAVRIAAPAALARLGPRAAPAIPALIKAVKAKGPLAAATLGMIGPLAKDAVPALREALADQDTVVTSPVLADTGDPATGPPSMSLAGAAAFALAQLGPDAAPAVPDLIKALGHKRPEDRTLAVQALGRVGGQSPEAVAALGRVLADDKELPAVQLAAVDALGKLGEAGTAPLVEALKSKKADVRRAAVTALAQSPALPAAAVPALAGRLRDDAPSVRTSAAAALGEIGERAKEAAPDLGRALAENGQPPEVVKAAAAALARLGDTGTAALVAALKDKQPAVRAAAAAAMGDVRMAPPSAVNALAEALGDDDSGVRVAAADSLGNIGRRAKSALSALEQHAKSDPNEEVRRAAAKAIASINRE